MKGMRTLISVLRAERRGLHYRGRLLARRGSLQIA
jgi:hypothetical protein